LSASIFQESTQQSARSATVSVGDVFELPRELIFRGYFSDFSNRTGSLRFGCKGIRHSHGSGRRLFRFFAA